MEKSEYLLIVIVELLAYLQYKAERKYLHVTTCHEKKTVLIPNNKLCFLVTPHMKLRLFSFVR